MTRTWSINKETAMVRSVAVKKMTKGAALRNMRRWPTKLFEISGNCEEITHTAAGPVKVPGKHRCYVVNDGDEFLVSDDTLKTIGIDIDRLLEQVARLQVDEDGDDLEEVGGDCVELPQRSAVRAATMKAALPVAKNEVEEALQGMIDGAHDIWQIKLDGSDPPAKVKPLKVTPTDGCVPYRCKGRKHNLLEERFLKLFAQELLNAGVKSNQQSAWCSPVNPVLKPDGRKSLKSADKWSDDDDKRLPSCQLANRAEGGNDAVPGYHSGP
ncbi:hypothetical protein DYB26_014129 [Aphanomyces astaci]|uniref:Uncharacterized protein n=1 Tax=Aphanomyces astaci TaxID=112090 RepID=A0A3R7C439_APHAT|nr:hypothetical protein DYB26_014129 [Aphanomyces astaci]